MLKKPLEAEELKGLATVGKLSVKELLNPKSAVFKKLSLDRATTSDIEAARLINENPRIMRRPILTDGKTLLLGFDAEDYAALAGL